MAVANRRFSAADAQGVYTLVLEIHGGLSLPIGALGPVDLPSGLFLYTGSALGPGGLDARLARHLRREKKIFWHIDYLTTDQRVTVRVLVEAECLSRLECRVNGMLLSLRGAVPIRGFGSSDCRASCPGHLLRVDGSGKDALVNRVVGVYREAGLDPRVRVLSG